MIALTVPLAYVEHMRDSLSTPFAANLAVIALGLALGAGLAASAAGQDSATRPGTTTAIPLRPAAQASAAPRARRDLDLTPPDIRRLLPESQWRSPLELPEDEPEPEDTVQVRAMRRTPDIPGGIASVFWALAHPSEAWRILAPAQ